MDAFTPATWGIVEVTDEKDNVCCYKIIDDSCAYDGCDREICRTTMRGGGWPMKEMSADEMLANARLIAVAPELLKALRSVLCDCGLQEIGHGGRMDRSIAAASAAIAKAEGR